MLKNLFNRLFRRPLSYALAVDTGAGLIVVGVLSGQGFTVPDKAKMQILGPVEFAKSPEGLFWSAVFEQVRKREIRVLIIPAAGVDVLVEMLKSAKDTRHQKFLVKGKVPA